MTGFSSWFLLSLVCGSWQVRQSRTAGGCTVPLMSAAFLSAWQVRQSADGVAVIELDAGDIFIDADLMAAQAARRHRGVDRLALGLVFVAFQALFGGDVLIQRDRMNRGRGAPGEESKGEACER